MPNHSVVDLEEKVRNLQGYEPMTVAKLISLLSGLPPMMDVYSFNGSEFNFINGVNVHQYEESPPVLVMFSMDAPDVTKMVERTYEEQMDYKRQQAMQMGRVSQKSTEMPEMVQ